MTTILPRERSKPEALTGLGDYATPVPGDEEGNETMNRTQIEGLLRDLGKWIAVFFVTKGWLDDATAQMVIAGGIGLLLSAWSYYTNATTTMVSAVATSDQVDKVVMSTKALAAADPNTKVVGPGR